MFLKRNFPPHVFRILFNNDPQQISFNSAKKMAKKMVPKRRKRKYNASTTPKDAFSEWKWIHFGNMTCMDSSIISLHGNVNNSKFILKNSPESRPATPLKILFTLNVKFKTPLQFTLNYLHCSRLGQLKTKCYYFDQINVFLHG